ncbi:hypothetical protein CEN40_21250 [Fischerella thermalis CCMEE 5205]|uniref:Uncharacterized protein n=1 Tax=Fischerella thermalis CCMEE 5318 TaxID=2019666 RepID=A0A2N6LC86_9CYAN|nr:hypothetical protein CEN46_16445 [Fischerella thermalis CCMEE 5318]PMB40954.1 hypothetical protein CEN40_21250 [Fischerella thermalis CCMEE 5205]PMB41665.1 hypothetical protein CEN47_02180 [Fischerella thermalis CCMEE 5319]
MYAIKYQVWFSVIIKVCYLIRISEKLIAQHEKIDYGEGCFDLSDRLYVGTMTDQRGRVRLVASSKILGR